MFPYVNVCLQNGFSARATLQSQMIPSESRHVEAATPSDDGNEFHTCRYGCRIRIRASLLIIIRLYSVVTIHSLAF